MKAYACSILLNCFQNWSVSNNSHGSLKISSFIKHNKTKFEIYVPDPGSRRSADIIANILAHAQSTIIVRLICKQFSKIDPYMLLKSWPVYFPTAFKHNTM